MRDKLVAVNGCFDPIHSGHIALFREAAKLGRVIVILKGDKRIRRKKIPLLSADERAEIVRSIRYVDDVFIYDCGDERDHEDFSEALEILKPDIYAAGADRKNSQDIPLIFPTCEKLGIKIIYGVGGDKISHSSEILKKYVKSINERDRNVPAT